MFRKVLSVSICLLVALLIAAKTSSAQNVAYRQFNLSSDVDAPGFAAHINPLLQDPWGIAFLPQHSFFIVNNENGRVVAQDASGQSLAPAAFIVSNVAGSGNGTVTGIDADSSLAFAAQDTNQFVSAVIVATEQGGLFLWGFDSQGNFPSDAILKANNSSSGAVYTSLAILAPSCCAPRLAAADFHGGIIQLFDTRFASLGSLIDPNLPDGFAPFGMQVIQDQLYVTFALQDAEKQNPLVGPGNGIVSVFDLDGSFVRRFVTAGPLNAPWGIAQAGPDFGPFAGAILIANAGDGVINAFNAATGDFLGRLQDGDGNPIRNSHVHGMIFGSRAFGDPNTLYFTAGINNGQDGLFGSIATGLVSATQLDVPESTVGQPSRISIAVSAGPGNAGTPSGLVSVSDGAIFLDKVTLTDGSATLDTVFASAGSHTLRVHYEGDSVFLPSLAQFDATVNEAATTIVLDSPSTAPPGSTILLTATVQSAGGVPTGQVDFRDGNATIGSAILNDAGVAILRSNTLNVGAHSLTAIYEGDGKFAGSTSPATTTVIVAPDFSLALDRQSSTVAAGQSAQFVLTVTPAGGFSDNVSFSCSAVAGVTCSFAPATIALHGAPATTTLTVTAASSLAASVFAPTLISAGTLLLSALILFRVFLRLQVLRARGQLACLLTVAATMLLVVGPILILGGCGGGASSATVSSGKAISVPITAQGGPVSHTKAVTLLVN